MPGNPTDAQAESLVVRELLGRASGVPRERLRESLSMHVSSDRTDAAVDSLAGASVLRTTPTRVFASDALRRLDALRLIPV
jgi:hypothetical protein